MCASLGRGLDVFLAAPLEAAALPDRLGFRRLNEMLDGYRKALRDLRDWSAASVEETGRRERAESVLEELRRDWDRLVTEGASAIVDAEALVDRLREELVEATAARLRLTLAGGEPNQIPEDDSLRERLDVLGRERVRLGHYQTLRRRWEHLTIEQKADDLVEDVRRSFVRATNLVCATTKGIVSRGSAPVRDTDYDTLIVDEASRVTESEFLIGAVRARRWILVGDEYQLPPHVDNDDEHHLHALTAVHRVERGAAESLPQAVKDLAGIWEEDEELRTFRRREVTQLAENLLSNGEWADGYRETYLAAYQHFGMGDDSDAMLLQAMRRHLVHSLFERVVHVSRAELRTPLVVQRRMVPALSRVVRQPVYGGRYQDPEPEELDRIGLRPVTTDTFPGPVVLIDTSAYQQAVNEQHGHGFDNQFERKAVLWALGRYDRELRDAGVRELTVSVLSFYKAQATALDREITRLKLDVLRPTKVDVIDAIQGQQADMIVISFVRTSNGRRVGPDFGRWLQDVRRLNVACTRARQALVLVGHADTLRKLNGVERAQRFYSHLFTLFANDPDYTTVRRFQ